MEIAAFDRHVQRLWEAGGRRASLLPMGLEVGIGLEVRTPRDRYDWQGLKRGDKAFTVIQYTLSGWGAYTDGQGRTVRVDPGSFFVAMVPSDHRYFLPPGSPTWRFLYVLTWHPWLLDRLGSTLREGHPVQEAPPDHPFTASLVRLWTAVRRGEFADDIAVERMLIDLGLEHDRLVRSRRAGGDERGHLLAEVRAHLEANPGRPVEVAELAEAAGSSRSAWSHRFAKVTGLSPARYIAQVRLEEVRRGLIESEATLAELARRGGFADANHLCKVFRRHFHQSPGQYRVQMGG